MALAEWSSIFQTEAGILPQGDTWTLEFDDSLVPDQPNPGWKQYIRNTGARFACSRCRRSWPSNRVMVVFHMRLDYGQGVVKARRFRQNCKKCSAAPMMEPRIDQDNIHNLMENLVKKIRIKCYGENLGEADKGFRSFDVKSPHEPSHCEACLNGCCERNTLTAAFSKLKV